MQSINSHPKKKMQQKAGKWLKTRTTANVLDKMKQPGGRTPGGTRGASPLSSAEIPPEELQIRERLL